MQKLKLYLITGLALAIIIFGSLIYLATDKLGQSKTLITQAISKGTQLDLNFDNAEIDWLQLLQLKPAITIKNLRIANPKGYLNPDFLQAKTFRVKISLWKLLWKKIHINNIVIREAVITLEQNRLGEKNLSQIITKLKQNASPIHYEAKSINADNSENDALNFNIEAIELDEFLIKKSKISLVSYMPGSKIELFDINNVNIQARNFSTNKASEFTINAAAFDTRSPVFSYKASIGPMYKDSIPTKGKLELSIKPRDIPQASRKKYFGNFLAEPGFDDLIHLETNLSGDLLKTIQGDGFLSIQDLHSGKTKNKQVVLNGLMPISLALSDLSGQAKLSLSSKDSSLQLDEDSVIKLNYKILSTNSKTSIKTRGSIEGLNINKLLTAYTSYENKLNGKFIIPDFDINLDGTDSEELLTSLDGFGSIRVSNGNLIILEKIYKLKGLLANYAELQAKLKDSNPASFSSLDSTFRIENRKLKNDSIKIVTPTLTFYGSGEFSFENQLDYHFLTKILAHEVPLYINGSADKPQLSLDTKTFTINELERQLKPFLDKIWPKNDG